MTDRLLVFESLMITGAAIKPLGKFKPPLDPTHPFKTSKPSFTYLEPFNDILRCLLTIPTTFKI